MEITIRHTPGCPNVAWARERLDEALREAGAEGEDIRTELVASTDDAERLGFQGSPTILIDGVDPFADPTLAPGLACRIYATPEGRETTPSVAQLREAIERRRA